MLLLVMRLCSSCEVESERFEVTYKAVTQGALESLSYDFTHMIRLTPSFEISTSDVPLAATLSHHRRRGL